MEVRRVVITGIGTINPLGNSVHDFFENLNIGKSGACPISRFDTTLFKTKFACEVKNFDPTSYGIDRKEIKKLDRYSQYAMVAADEAIADSGLDIDKVDKSRIGVIIGSGIGGLETLSQEIMGYCDGGKIPRFNPFLIPKLIPDIAAGCVSIKYGFMGPNYATVSACASSSHAIGDSYNAIKYGKAEVIISGGAEACVTIPSVGGFNSAQALSTNNDEYETASRPFDKTRDGFVLGEGSGILVLEEYNHAKERGAHIYAEIIGMGMSADAYHITAPHPEGKGAILAMSEALKDASILPEDVDYINVHGTSTPLGDIAELKAIKDLFKEHAYKLSISSTKSMTGHLLGAAGAVESIACIYAINNSIIPPTINFKVEDPEIDYNMDLTLNHPKKKEVRIAMNNTFGFGGHNTCLVFKAIK